MTCDSETPRRSRLARAALLASTALALPAAAFAQAAPAPRPDTAAVNGPTDKTGSTDVSEIVVTAQKRAQNLQDVPISIQALDTRKLDQLQVQKFEDYVKYLPSVSISGGNPGGNATVVVRGIATDGGNYVQGALPTVGIYLDEQPITTINGALDLHIYDIARVESLSGPQGTLFGASSEAGTLRVITNKPDPGKFSAGYDLEANRYTGGGPGGQVEGFVNQPLGDRMALRVVGYANRDGGYIDNVFRSRTYPTAGITVSTKPETDYNTVDTYGGRAALAVKLNEDWTVTPSIIGQYQYREGSFSEFPAAANGNSLVTQRYGKEYSRDQFYQAGLTVTGKIADFDVTYSGSYLKRDSIGDNDYADYSFFYDEFHRNNAGDIIDPTQTFVSSGSSEKISQEGRIATPQSWRLRGMAGVFWQHQTEDFRYDYRVNGLADASAVTNNPGSFYLDDGQRIDRDFAVFTQWDFDVTKALTLTAGMRYYRYDNTLTDFNGTHGSEPGCLVGTGNRNTPCTSLGVVRADGSIGPVEVEDDGFTYRFNATYKFNPDHLVYATVSTGFRPGGANSRSTVDPTASITYGAEDLTNYELGTKNTFFDRRLTFNATLFWEEWDNIQLSVETFNALTGTGGIYTIQNAGSARSRGAEVDFTLRPIRGLTLTSASTYTKAELTKDYDNGFGVVAPKGETLPFTPAFKSNLIARYEFDIGDYRAHVQGAEVYQSSAWNNFENYNRLVYGRRNAYAISDLSAGVEKDRKTFEVYLNNAFDRRGITKKMNGCGVGTCNPDQYVIYNQPRIVGVRFGQRF